MTYCRVSLTKISGNAKTGPMPVSMTEKLSCPSDCPLAKNGCYADTGHINIHWSRLSRHETGMAWNDFVKEIARLPKGILWRHNQAGDLPKLNHIKQGRDNKGRFLKKAA